MILSLFSLNETVQIEITPEDFKHLRDPKISNDKIAQIAESCSISSEVLLTYINDLRTELRESPEIDSACDYTDHFS
ncbi:MAG: hypothetical protein PHO27_09605 [Sulfuricurvum sp.]|nr:hypothetical protein [Sulfuricurvum sp.]